MNLSTRTTAESASRSRGFTLLEVILGLALIVLLIGGIYSIAAASLQMSNSVVENQASEMHLHSFVNLLRRNIEGLPGNARLRMEAPDTAGGVYHSELVLEEYPLAFSWANVAAGSRIVILATEKDPLGGIRFRVRYLNEEDAEAYESGNLGADDGIGLELLDGVRAALWRFYDTQTEEWVEEWPNSNQRPSMIELNFEFYDGSEPTRAVFWIPVVADPAQIVQGATSGGAGGGGAGAPGGGGPPIPGGVGGGGRPQPGQARPPGEFGGGGARAAGAPMVDAAVNPPFAQLF
jgi:prepilin-type N-terminal cleavage/methylation domain-containing protein